MSGKNLLLPDCVLALPCSICPPNELNGDLLKPFSGATVVLLNRMFLKEVFFGSWRIAELDCLTHCLHTKKSRDSLGAARRIPGNNEAIEVEVWGGTRERLEGGGIYQKILII